MDSCRACLREEMGVLGYCLFDSAVRPMTDFLMVCTSLKILEDDGLPTRICDECHAKLTSFQAFCQQIIESDILYRKNRHVKVELAEDESAAAASGTGGGGAASSAVFYTTDDSTHPIASECVKFESNAASVRDYVNDDDDDEDDDYEDDRTMSQHRDSDGESDPSYSETSSSRRQQRPSKSAGSSGGSVGSAGKRREPGQRKRPYAPRGPRVVDKSTRYECDMCDKHFYDKIRLTGHLRQHCGLRPFPCDQCSKEYDKHCKLRVHQQRHAPPEPEQVTPCPHEGCPKTYRHPRYAQDHYERIHLGLRPKLKVECICETCGKSFMTRSSLLQHMKSHMDVEQYPFQCEVCQKRFLAKNGYQLHMLRHNNIRNFPCPLCPARMVSQLELNYHVAKHDKSVPWPCPECSMVFQRKASLRRHELKVHRGYKPYVCSFCSRAFGKKLSLINHERLHTGERPHACPICDRRFVQLVHMKSHVKTHNKGGAANPEASAASSEPAGPQLTTEQLQQQNRLRHQLRMQHQHQQHLQSMAGGGDGGPAALVGDQQMLFGPPKPL